MDIAWDEIFRYHDIAAHDFSNSPFPISAGMIKAACQDFKETTQKEPRILCKQDTREIRPRVFTDNDLFILPVKNGEYVLVRGEGYVDIPPITSEVMTHVPKIDFPLYTSEVGDSEMQHLDYAYAVSMVRTFVDDDSLVLTIRGRKFTPPFAFRVGQFTIETRGVQTEVDSGYEGRKQIVLVEAKNRESQNTIIRQLYYPYRQWHAHVGGRKEVSTVFFTKQAREYHFWQFAFSDIEDYNSIHLVRSARMQLAGV